MKISSIIFFAVFLFLGSFFQVEGLSDTRVNEAIKMKLNNPENFTRLEKESPRDFGGWDDVLSTFKSYPEDFRPFLSDKRFKELEDEVERRNKADPFWDKGSGLPEYGKIRTVGVNCQALGMGKNEEIDISTLGKRIKYYETVVGGSNIKSLFQDPRKVGPGQVLSKGDSFVDGGRTSKDGGLEPIEARACCTVKWSLKGLVCKEVLGVASVIGGLGGGIKGRKTKSI